MFSREAHAEILSIDDSAAIAMSGVKAFVTAKDVPGHNEFGAIAHDEEVFATSKVVCVGQPIGMIVAETQVDLA